MSVLIVPDVSLCFRFFIPVCLNSCFVTGETLFIIFFMAVIISIPWMVYGWFFLLLQRLFSLYQYVGFNILTLSYILPENCSFFNIVSHKSKRSQFQMVKTAFHEIKDNYSLHSLMFHLVFRGQTTFWQSHLICLINEGKTLKRN